MLLHIVNKKTIFGLSNPFDSDAITDVINLEETSVECPMVNNYFYAYLPMLENLIFNCFQSDLIPKSKGISAYTLSNENAHE